MRGRGHFGPAHDAVTRQSVEEVPMKAAAAGNQGVMEVKTKLLGSFAIVAAFAAVLTLGEGTAQAATCSVPSISYPTIRVKCKPEHPDRRKYNLGHT